MGTRRRRRLPVAAVALAAVALGIGGCSTASPHRGETTSTPTSSPSSTEATPTATSSGPVDLDIETALEDVSVIQQTFNPPIDIDVAGSELVASLDGEDVTSVAFSSRGGGPLQRESYSTGDPLRYVGAVQVAGQQAVLVDAPALDRLEETGPARVLAVRPKESPDISEITPPNDMTWSHFPGLVATSEGQFAGVAVESDGSGECLAILSPPEGTARKLRCWPDKTVFFVAASDGGFSMFLTDVGNSIADCRERVFVDFDGEERLIGEDDTCRAYDGVTVGGWDVWTQSTESDYAMPLLSRSTLLARDPEGNDYDFGVVVTGSLILCGDRVYWYEEEASNDLDGSDDLMMAWRPGEDTIFTVYRSPSGTHAGGMRCADGRPASAEVDETSGVTTFFYLDSSES